MSSNPTDIYSLSYHENYDDKSELVTMYIENVSVISYIVNRSVVLFNLRKTMP